MKYITTVYDLEVMCSKHKTLSAAIKAAKNCERIGGTKHQIWEVKEIKWRKK
jgi:hypothetical protein